jgi:multisubunit Na+/H+ antiporter MnhF subunit
MPIAEAHIVTPRAERFLTQLCRHAEAMGGKARHLHGGDGQARPEVVKVEYAGNEGKITFSGGDCTLRSTSDTLTVQVEADDADRLARLQGILTADLERFGRREDLKVSWHGQDSPGPGRDIGVVRRSRGTTIALVVAVTSAVAAHLVFGGAALAAWRWTSVAADIVLALVILKIVAVAVFARHRIRGHGRGLPAFASARAHRGTSPGGDRRENPTT